MSYETLPFIWTAEVFGTNNAQMDEEHAGLFTAIDILDSERTVESFESLAGLVIAHFADEEKACGLSAAHLVSRNEHHITTNRCNFYFTHPSFA